MISDYYNLYALMQNHQVMIGESIQAYSTLLSCVNNEWIYRQNSSIVPAVSNWNFLPPKRTY